MLAERLEELLDEVAAPAAAPPSRRAPPTSTTSTPLDAPVDEEFRVGDDGAGLGRRRRARRHRGASPPASEPTSEDAIARPTSDEGPDALRVRLTAGARPARSSPRARRVVAAGRPPCPLCGLPLDPDGPRLPAAERLPPLTGDAAP